ncbi:aspartate-semialdehyde dehydrogenase [Gammaproteobacteria bacterium]|nr:aspartate-semialdehyde dehydrogenase [Gammaproteobacteria bacterium]
MSNSAVNLALVGATGVVGAKIIKLLEKKSFPLARFIPLGHSTVGNHISLNGEKYVVQSLESFQPTTVNLIIFAAGSATAHAHARAFVDAGAYVIDLSSHFRYEDDVPLVIPEINGHLLDQLEKPSLIANPNCSTAQLLMALKPIHDALNIELMNVATYQAVSGTGKAALEELHNQTYFTDSPQSPSAYPKQIAFNVIPQCDVFLDNNFTKEEMKLTWETHKILDPKIFVQATCARVPVFNGHSEAVFFKVSRGTSRDNIISILSGAEGVKVIDNPDELEYPTPVECANDTEDVFVGRIRVQELGGDTWVSLWIVADNVYGKGAALNAVQIAERLLQSKKL